MIETLYFEEGEMTELKTLKADAEADDKSAGEKAGWERLDKFDAAWDKWEAEQLGKKP
jgi:hypothetical protein